MATKKPILAACVRITANNKAIRGTFNGSTTTVNLDEGVYWVGLNGTTSAGSWGTDASFISSPDSLLKEFKDKTGIHAVIEYADQTALSSPGDTGHVHMKRQHSADTIEWNDSATTVNPLWFGVTKTGASQADTTFTGAGYEDVSDVSSSLVFVADKPAVENKPIYRFRTKRVKTDSGKIFGVYFGKDVGSRDLGFKLEGVPAEAIDNTYNSMRRFVEHMNESQQSLFFIQDVAQKTAMKEWDPDNTSGEGYRYGYQRCFISNEGNNSLGWELDPMFANYYRHWNYEFTVDPYVS